MYEPDEYARNLNATQVEEAERQYAKSHPEKTSFGFAFFLFLACAALYLAKSYGKQYAPVFSWIGYGLLAILLLAIFHAAYRVARFVFRIFKNVF